MSNKQGKVYVMLGLDCDSPRGALLDTKTGGEMLRSLERIRITLDEFGLPRTYFICGQFLEGLARYCDHMNLARLFEPQNSLVEIADHSYSHSVLKPVRTRPDKKPIDRKQVEKEFFINSRLFLSIFGDELLGRGFRTPLGHYRGLYDAVEAQLCLKSLGVSYVSSDLRDINHSIHPKLEDEVTGNLRQPLRYPTGLLEIPSHGWQDTAFMGLSSTPLFEFAPKNFHEIVCHYHNLFKQAREKRPHSGQNVYLGLVLHPYNISQYDREGLLIESLRIIANEFDIHFCRYVDCATDSVFGDRA